MAGVAKVIVIQVGGHVLYGLGIVIRSGVQVLLGVRHDGVIALERLGLLHLDGLAVDLHGLQGDDIGFIALVDGVELQRGATVWLCQDGDITDGNLFVIGAGRSAINRSYLLCRLGDVACRARSQRQSGDGGNGNNGTATGGGLQGLHVEHPPSIAISGLIKSLA